MDILCLTACMSHSLVVLCTYSQSCQWSAVNFLILLGILDILFLLEDVWVEPRTLLLMQLERPVMWCHARRFGGRSGGDGDAGRQRTEPDAVRAWDGPRCRGVVDQDPRRLWIHYTLGPQAAVVHLSTWLYLPLITLYGQFISPAQWRIGLRSSMELVWALVDRVRFQNLMHLLANF